MNKKCCIWYVLLTLISSVSAVFAVDSSHVLLKNGIGKAKLGMKFDTFVTYIEHDTIKIDDDGWHLFKDGKAIISICDKDWNKTKTVRMISVYSDLFETNNGVHAGMSINDFLKIYPNEFLYSDPDDGYCFIPKKMQTYSRDKNNQLFFYFFVEAHPDQPLMRPHFMGKDVVKKYSKKGFIQFIKFGYWN